MRAPRAVDQYLVLTVLKTQAYTFVRCDVALELISDQNLRGDTALPEQFAHQFSGCILVTPTLHQDLQHDAKQIHHAPRPMFLVVDGNNHFIRLLFVAKARPSCPNASSRLLSQLERSAPNHFVGHANTVSGQHFLAHTKAQRKAKYNQTE